LTNQLNDAKKRQTKAEAELNSHAVGTNEYVEAEAKLNKEKKAVKDLEDRRTAGEQAYAQMNKQDAEIRVESLQKELDSRKEEIARLAADNDYF
jgi:hypothetical protein